MQAILVKYHPATTYRGACYIATAAAGRLKVSAADISSACPHPRRLVAEALVLGKMAHAPHCDLLEGTLPNGDSVFVFDHPLSRTHVSTQP